jgi:type II secretory pathway component PulF
MKFHNSLVVRAVRWAWDRDRQGVTFFFVCSLLILIPAIAPYPLEARHAPDWLLVLVGLASFAGIVCLLGLALLTASQPEQPQGNVLKRAWWAFLRWNPVQVNDEMLFAEAMSQALSAGLGVPDAMLAAAEVNPSARLRAAMRKAASNCCSGRTVEESVANARICVTHDLLAALRVGEERGCLSSALSQFARARDQRAATRLAQAVKRSAEASRFADILADLLATHRLTPRLLLDAGDLAGDGNSASRQAVARAAASVENGLSLGEALREQAGVFDPFFCRVVDAPADRSHLRAVLKRLADTSKTTE